MLLSSIKESSKTHSPSLSLSKWVEDSLGHVLCQTKISSSPGYSKGSIVEKGSSGWREKESFFMASVIPAALHPFVIIYFPAVNVKWLYDSISQLAWSGLIFENNSLTFISFVFFPLSSCFITFKLYYLENFFFRKALAFLFTVKSSGWNKFVILAGTFTYLIWFLVSLSIACVGIWPLKTPKISNVGWDDSNFNRLRSFLT